MPSAKPQPRLGPFSRAIDRGAVGWSISGRSREGRFLRAYEAMLVKHVGGSPSAVQKALIGRAAKLALHVELMDERSLAAGGMSERDSRQYLAWSNSLNRCLREIGVQGVAERPMTPTEFLARKKAAAAAAAAAAATEAAA